MGVRWWTRGRKAVASVTAIAIAVGVPLGAAILHRGYPVTDVQLQTRDVWVTNGDDILAGRLNRQIEELDASVAAATPALDVVQNGNGVFLFDTTAATLERVDPAFTRLSERVDLPDDAVVRLGGTTLAILDAEKGSLWIVDVATALDFDPIDEPVLELGRDAAVAVSTTGTVFATSPSTSTLVTVSGVGAKPVETEFSVSADHQLAAVGEIAVALDTQKNMLVRSDGGVTPLGDMAALRLQQSGAESGSAIVATGDSLLRVSLATGEIEVGATPITTPAADESGVSAPVWLDGCAHGAWGAAQQYALWCDGEPLQAASIAQPTRGSILEFRVNRSVIALNNLSNGNVWLVDNKMRLVENWDQVTPPLQEETEEGDEKSSTQSFEDTLSERTDTNRAPIAISDDFGARAGRTTILPVIENDSDPDGDVLTVVSTSVVDESQGILDFIDGGRALQFTPAPEASNASFRYTISDGRGGVAESTVSVRVVPPEQNAAPVEKRTTSVGLEVGSSITYNVLTDWTDPDGDDLTLTGAFPASGDEVRFTPDGVITFQSKTAELGEKEVRLTVSDGTAEATGTFIVDIAAPGTLTPIGTPDFAETFVNETVSVSPLLNDISPSGQPLALVGVDETPANLQVTAKPAKESITFSSGVAGTYYVIYSLSAGPATSIGLIRVDVKADPDNPLRPIAVKDTAYLRPGEPTIIKVLGNDVSPSGLVLAVQSTDTTTTNPALSVEVLNNTVIRVTSSAALTEQTQFTYTVSDGVLTALAGVTIVPVAPIVNRQPPVATDDAVRVRAGDFVSVDVLANDYHPDDSQVLLQPELADSSLIGDGIAFVNNQRLRFQAPAEPGEHSVIYRIADQFGESATATVVFTVIGRDDESNQPPVPEVQTARVFAGATVTIQIPLDEIDPDGDSVVVTAITSPATMGTLDNQTPSSVDYIASSDAAGTDTFTYEVQDTFGEKAIGTIKVGIIPLPPVSDPPNAVDDSVELKPGRTASVAVLDNDSDPSGFTLKVAPKLAEVDKGIDATVEKNKVVIEAPSIEGTFAVRYSIDNGHGGVASAFIQVRVTEDAKPVYPTAKDRYVTVAEVIDGDGEVVVPLDGLVSNPAGRDDELVISLSGPHGELGVIDRDTRSIVVRPTDLRSAIAYTVTNEVDGLSASAFIIVPPKVNANFAEPPFRDPEFPTPQIDMNASGEWDLADFMIVPSGNKAIITDKATLTSTNGKAVWIDKDTIGFESALDFRGAASVSFQVTDGVDKDDVNGLFASITLPIAVGNPDYTDTAPTFTKQDATIEPRGKELVIDLRASTSHPNPAMIDSFRYTGLTGSTGDITGEIRGGELVVTAPFGTPSGRRAVFEFTVEFEDFSIPGTVTVTSIASSAPLPQAVQDDDLGRRGVAQPSYNVLDNDYNPFAEDGEILRVLDAEIENQAASGAGLDWNADGEIEVTPGPTFIGAISVVYRIGDATKDESREVQGRYILTVRDAPDKVATPVATPGDLQATVTWDAPATNGEPISGYTVTWTPAHGPDAGSASLPAGAASYTATGLANGTDYTFRVSATNLMGTSTVSDPSAAARPKGQATAPTTAVATPSTDGSGRMTMSWSGAGANGGAITGYDWTVRQGATVVDSGHTATTTATSTASTLIVGQLYTFTVVANATGGDSVPSSASNGVASSPGKPTVALSAPYGEGDYRFNASYGPAPAFGVAPGAVSYSYVLSGLGNGTQPAPYSWTSGPGTANSSHTLTVTATVGTTSNSASASATAPGSPTPQWYANASNSCLKWADGSSGYTAQSPCPLGYVNGSVRLFCRVQWGTFTWYLVQRDANNMILRDFTLSGWSHQNTGLSLPPNC